MVVEIHAEDYMDYLTPDGLTKVSGVEEKYHIALAIKELVDNGLDSSGGYCSISPFGSNAFYIVDEGPGIGGSDEEIAYLFSITRKTYSTKGERYPRRGYVGRGLRFVTGVLLCHSAILKVSTRGRTLLLKPSDNGTTYERVTDGPHCDCGTSIYIEFPRDLPSNSYRWGRLAIELAAGRDYKGYSSPWWYDSRSFYALLKSIDYKNKKVINVLREIFGGRYSIKVFNEQIQRLLNQRNAKEITLDDSRKILEKLRRIHKPIKPSRLGCVGRMRKFKYYLRKIGEYEEVVGEGGEETLKIPFVVELWAQPTYEAYRFSGEIYKYKKIYGHLTVFVNKSPLPIPPIEVDSSFEMPNKIGFSIRLKNLKKIKNLKMYTEFYLNIITPYLPIVSESKIPTLPSKLNNIIEELFLRLVKRINREKTSQNYPEKQYYRDHMAIKIREIRDKVLNENLMLLEKEGLINKRSEYLEVLKNDPFITGESQAKINQALWFQEIWNRLNPDNKVIHLRRLHYQIVSQPTKIMRHTNQPYENTYSCWLYLLNTSKYARELGLIDPLKIIDRRAPPLFGRFVTSFHLRSIIDFPDWCLPEITLTSLKVEELKIPEFKIDFQSARETISALQPVHLEVWTEKATMNDILEDICEKYGVILVQNVGYASITNIERFLRERAMKTEKPSVILYISDFDSAGENMPVTVSRTLQHRIFKLKNEGLLSEEKEICVNPIILTKEQIESKEFAMLPKAPGKTKKEREVTELDALEAVMPGKFREIVEKNIEEFIDRKLMMNLQKNIESKTMKFNKKLREKVSPQIDQLLDIQKKLTEIGEKFRQELERIQESLKKELAPYERDLSSLREKIEIHANKLQNRFKINLSSRKKPSLDDRLLFLSSRSFKEQTEKLKNYRIFKN